MNIYVGNLSYDTTEEQLEAKFAEFGAVSSCSVIKDGYSGRSKGFGFVEMDAQAEAEEAIKVLNGESIDGRELKVNQAKPRNDRSSKSRSGSDW